MEQRVAIAASLCGSLQRIVFRFWFVDDAVLVLGSRFVCLPWPRRWRMQRHACSPCWYLGTLGLGFAMVLDLKRRTLMMSDHGGGSVRLSRRGLNDVDPSRPVGRPT
jgi:hypothetical protein